MRIPINELRLMVRKQLELFLEDFAAKEMPNGSAWKTKNKGWAAKNSQGVTNYWYGPDEAKNKASADAFKRDSSKKATNELKSSTLGSYVKKATDSAIDHAVDSSDGFNKASMDKADKRGRGIKNATDKLTTRASRNELSTATLNSYKEKAASSQKTHDQSASKHASIARDHDAEARRHREEEERHDAKADKRRRGIDSADDKLGTYESIQTNELNQSTLQSYKAKSQNSMREPVKKAMAGKATDTDYSKFRKRAKGITTATDKLKTGSYSDRKKTEK